MDARLAYHAPKHGMTFIYVTSRLSWLFVHRSNSPCLWLSNEHVLAAIRPSLSPPDATNSLVSVAIRCAMSVARTSETEKATGTSASISDQMVDEGVQNAQSAICTDVKMMKL